MSNDISISEAAAEVLKRIFASDPTKVKTVNVEFAGSTSQLISCTIQSLLIEKGYISYVVIQGGNSKPPGRGASLVVDITRRRPTKSK
jgi:hypothetical protein